ncbi:hypothetical protein BST22_17440 [Mycolicibacterium chubuense]|uniref:Uncharacterized protein n=1 Tax=Mycolicibacterium chubuense TaxID=1800 RepID=A0A0J6YJU4_MYCCU|nr:hypothetical protein [Mycolicibacterium chubuense]KMO73086.1 hypothetical protein MCHUDSM44219_04263 [Mycolicibacterium chubuense]ORA49323.1 hypothetical protein BST22_17440 [Mycolicibacterium chubuense]SPX98623.1 Uncharacterised protein [Mycolicibacterium chubuense]
MQTTRDGADHAQAAYYLTMLAMRWQTLETEIVERCNELRRLTPAARKAERGRNIRRLIRVKQSEVARLREMCAALAQRLDER